MTFQLGFSIVSVLLAMISIGFAISAIRKGREAVFHANEATRLWDEAAKLAARSHSEWIPE